MFQVADSYICVTMLICIYSLCAQQKLHNSLIEHGISKYYPLFLKYTYLPYVRTLPFAKYKHNTNFY